MRSQQDAVAVALDRAEQDEEALCLLHLVNIIYHDIRLTERLQRLVVLLGERHAREIICAAL